MTPQQNGKLSDKFFKECTTISIEMYTRKNKGFIFTKSPKEVFDWFMNNLPKEEISLVQQEENRMSKSIQYGPDIIG